MRGFFSPLAALALLMTCFGGAAQEPATTQQPAATRPQYQGEATTPRAVFEGRIPAGQLKFLKAYPGHPEKKLNKDKQFNALLKQVIPKTTYHYGKDMSLSDTVDLLLHSGSAAVSMAKDRYVMVATSEGPYLRGRAFLWIDSEQGIALGGVFFKPTNGEPTPTLAIFSNQLRVSELKMSQLPAVFLDNLRVWSAELNIPVITTRYFIPQSGHKYLLEHDEDLCSGDLRQVVVDETCQQRKVDAAQTDVEAAAFMLRNHNAANATAWHLKGIDVEQVEWEQQRQKTCGTGPGNLECWLRMTHERTVALIAKRKQ